MKAANVLIAGSTGMVGGLALTACLESPEVGRVTTLVRRATGQVHEKLREIVHADFLDYRSAPYAFDDQDLALFCIGVYTGQVSSEESRTITVDYTEAFAKKLRERSPRAALCFLSGQGADPTETSRMSFARDKGAAENALSALGFSRLHVFRPGYIYPPKPRKEPNLSYRVMRALYPALRVVYPNVGIAADALANVMLDVGLHGVESGDVVLENKAIRALAGA
jgi:uncharacterized protein YbjT (DUF2867 family)